MKEAIEVLAKKAKNTQDATDALKFSQAALNLAHAEDIMKATGKV